MKAQCLTPILNVSDLQASFDWFALLGWTQLWAWGEPPGFGCVGSGECEIFLCVDGQGGRGKGGNTATFAQPDGERHDAGVWMSVWVEDVDAVYQTATAADIEVMHPPEDMPGGVRECHIRHPDGHVFRVSKSIHSEDES